MPPRLYVVDHFALAFRSYFAFIKSPLINSKGEQTSVLFGYLNSLFRMIHEMDATHIAIAKDLPGPTFRNSLYPEYKANRPEMDPDMKVQLKALDEFLELSGIPVFSHPDFEADDIMATLGKQMDAENVETFFFTKDKDLCQFLSPSVKMFQLDKMGKPPIVMGPEYVLEKFGVQPEKARDFQALKGDASDNVPGVPKIGDKTAALLLNDFGSLEGIYEHVDRITKKAVRESLIANEEKAFLSQKLVTMSTDVPISANFSEMRIPSLDLPELYDFFDIHELNSVRKNHKKACSVLSKPEQTLQPMTAPEKTATYTLINQKEDWKKLLLKLQGAPQIAFDTETSGLDTKSADFAGLCFSIDEDEGFYVPLKHKDSHCLDEKEILKDLESIFERSDVLWFMHNAKFDLQMLFARSIQISGPIFDTMIASYLLNPGVHEHSLDQQVAQRLQHQMIPIEELIGKGKNQISFVEISAEKAAPYSAEDAVYTFRLAQVLQKEIAEKDLTTVLETLEIPLMRVLTEMEFNGISIDTPKLKSISEEMGMRIQSLQQEIWDLAGEEFNIASPKQLGDILFGKLGLKGSKKTKTGYSTNAAVLHSLRKESPIIAKILEFRELEKLKNTYVDVLPELVHPQTQRVHTSFSQTIAATGRLSSLNPNLQNIPIRTEEGRKVRSCFITSQADTVLLSVDYSQIELRVLADLSGDEALIKAYCDGIDIHTQTAARLFKCSLAEVTSEQRRQSKAVNFGILYGMSAFRLSNELEIPRYLAQEFIESYFEAYPKVTQFINDTVTKAREDGYVETLFGHRRYLPEIDSENANERSGAERIAVNTPIQGTAAGLIKKAMIAMPQAIAHLPCKMLLQIHDELVFEVRKDALEEAQKIIVKTMQEVVQLKVPLIAEAGFGANWLKAH